MFFKLIAPENFETKFPNYVRQKFIPLYHERVNYPADGIVSTKDPRTRDALEKLGFQTIFSSGVPVRPTPSPEEETWEEDTGNEVMFEDIEELGDPNLDYCKYCGKGFEEVPKDHVEGEHDLDWEEYERLPEMVPPLAMKIYWASKELQECFPEPMNLLCDHGLWANYLHWVKEEGTKRSRKLAEYYGTPFRPTDKKNLIPERLERDFEEYCNICGTRAESIGNHIIGHGITITEYRKLDKKIPDVGMDLWYAHADLRKAFPSPMDLHKGYGSFSSYDSWLRSDGVKKHKKIREYYTGKKSDG